MMGGHKDRFDALLRAAVPTLTAAPFTVAANGVSVIHYDAVSGTWYDPTVYGQIIRPPVAFDFQREAHEAEWPTERLEARWRDLLKTPDGQP